MGPHSAQPPGCAEANMMRNAQPRGCAGATAICSAQPARYGCVEDGVQPASCGCVEDAERRSARPAGHVEANMMHCARPRGCVGARVRSDQWRASAFALCLVLMAVVSYVTRDIRLRIGTIAQNQSERGMLYATAGAEHGAMWVFGGGAAAVIWLPV